MNTDIFIVYGMSLGENDHFWWNIIGRNLKTKNSKLIIYNFVGNLLDLGEDEENSIKEQVIEKFITVAVEKNFDLKKAKESIIVVNHNGKYIYTGEQITAFNVD